MAPWIARLRNPTGASVFPESEEAEHSLDCDAEYDCPCDPEVNWLNDDGMPYPNGPVIIHNAHDGSE